MTVGKPGNLTLACCSLSCFRWIGLRKLLYNIFLEQKNIINMFLRLLHSLGPVPIQFTIHLINKLFAAKSPLSLPFLVQTCAHGVYANVDWGFSLLCSNYNSHTSACCNLFCHSRCPPRRQLVGNQQITHFQTFRQFEDGKKLINSED